jgi:type II secretory pathway component PulK
MKLRLGMRTALWIVALAALLAGWMADRYRLELRHHEDALKLSRMKARALASEQKVHRLKLSRLQEAMNRRVNLSREGRAY